MENAEAAGSAKEIKQLNEEILPEFISIFEKLKHDFPQHTQGTLEWTTNELEGTYQALFSFEETKEMLQDAANKLDIILGALNPEENSDEVEIFNIVSQIKTMFNFLSDEAFEKKFMTLEGKNLLEADAGKIPQRVKDIQKKLESGYYDTYRPDLHNIKYTIDYIHAMIGKGIEWQ
ncbi:hypothetical protein K9M58_03525 [Candidatus Gracilibacteria bacterium]|nr:hypothetical protein [Candidatus Gracilibacteria bacterium]